MTKKARRAYHFTPDEWENVQNQISSTISLIEAHIIPDIPEAEADLLRGYLLRMQAACRMRAEDTQEIEA